MNTNEDFVYTIHMLNQQIKTHKIAIDAISKQIEESAVLKERDGKYKWVCGRCGHVVESCLRYCDECGQKIRWK